MLHEKLFLENICFTNDLQKKSAQEIIDSAQEIVTRKNLIKFFEHENLLEDSQAKWLFDHYTLHQLHNDWCDAYGRLEDVEVHTIMEYAEGSKIMDEEYRIYKAEISIPDEEFPHLEVFSADNDVEAVEKAYELCESDDMYLLEVHELDANYSSIREINLQYHDPSLRRFMNVDLIDFLGQIAEKTITNYPNDWKLDKEWLVTRADSSNPEDKHIAWHVCSYGTHMLTERNVFIKESGAFKSWTDYHQNAPDMFGFFVEITGREGNKVFGNVFEVGDYVKHVEQVWDTALPIDTVTIEYSEQWGVNCGLTITVPRKEYDDNRHRLMNESGNVISIRFNPLENNITMSDVLKTERAHRMGMPIGNTEEYLKKLDAKLLVTRGVTELVQPKENALQSQNKPQSFVEILKQAQEKANDINRQNTHNKEQAPICNNKNNLVIGE